MIRKVYHFLLAYISYWLFGRPSKKIIVIGVTGTKGKSTTCRYITSVLEAGGYKVGLLSTVDIQIAGRRVLNKYKIDPQRKPLICQISRYDALKDPVGVIQAYKLVKKYVDCQLLLVGNRATDDPEGDKIYKQVLEAKGDDPDITALMVEDIPSEINAFQRVSDVMVQKSIREGFALTVSEALWKGKPVVASNVGGIPLQVKHKYSGMLCHTIEGAAFSIKQLLNTPEYARRLGENGREHIRQNFLLTRHIKEYMLLFLSLYSDKDVVTL